MSTNSLRQPAQMRKLARSKNYLDLCREGEEQPVAEEQARYVNLEPDNEQPASQTSAATEDQRNEYSDPQLSHGGRQTEDNKIELLRGLLAIERERNEQRRKNGLALQRLVGQLQADYLKLQRDFVENLELAHKVNNQRGVQLQTLQHKLDEKDRLIEELRSQIDENKLRQEYENSLAKQADLWRAEEQQLRNQLDLSEQQLSRERTTHSETLQQFQARLDEQQARAIEESRELEAKLLQTKEELDRLMREPKEVQVASLRQENNRLAIELDKMKGELETSGAKMERNSNRVADLVGELEQLEARNDLELSRLEQELAEQRRLANELRMKLEDKDEIVQVCQFNLQRSEKRVKSLLGALKSKEATYKELVQTIELRHEQAYEKISQELRQLQRSSVELESELERKQAEIVRLELEHANQLESMRADRDCRLQKAQAERQKADKDLKAVEVKLARELEAEELRVKQLEQLQREVQQFRDESKRLSIELTKSEAKLYAKQQELDQIKRAVPDDKEMTESRLIDQRQFSAELAEVKRVSRRLESRCEEYKLDNEKLRMKLRLSEANMSRINSAINKEQAKMAHEYERKLEQITVEQSAYEKNRVRYKRYGNKLKRYCEHLRQVHQHICTPGQCGILISGCRDDTSPAKEVDESCDHNYYYCIDSSSL